MFCVALSTLYGKVEVIKINCELTGWTKTYFWPGLANGGIIIDEEKIILPNGNKLYIQSRSNPDEFLYEKFMINGKSSFIIRKVLFTKSGYCFTVFRNDGRFYLYKPAWKDNLKIGPEVKHGNSQRLLSLPSHYLLASGLYRPANSIFLDRYDDESNGAPTELSKTKYKELYQLNKAFTISFYDENLQLVDSANVLNRVGENASAFEDLWTTHPIDIDSDASVYLIDNDIGYRIKQLAPPYKHHELIAVENDLFKEIPGEMTDELYSTFKRRQNSYSEAYALYVKGIYIITSFYSAPVGRDLPEPPYYYDIIKKDGAHVSTGIIKYPIITEDESDKVFLYVKRDGGWFEDDQIYLVGLTMEDFFTGKAETQYIDEAIKQYENNAKTH